MSAALLGTQIDAVYHTSVVFDGLEYLYGRGIQTCIPGFSHHAGGSIFSRVAGQPIEVLTLGETSLPKDVIWEYLESLKEIYAAEAYDLFLHNCNNFTNDLSTFLVGRGIPDHITSLPQTFLNSPLGVLLKPTLENAMRPITQASLSPVPSRLPQPRAPTAVNLHPARAGSPTGVPPTGIVHTVSSLHELDTLLSSASKSCAVVFFTSSTCPPCKLLYPVYDELAAEAGTKSVFAKVDIGTAYDVGAKYGIRATPTFVTFLKGEKENEWKGANEGQLRGNIRLLLQMAWPPHPHLGLSLPVLLGSNLQPITYSKLPPLDKLLAKMGDASNDTSVVAVKEFVSARSSQGAAEATLPNLTAFSRFLRESTKTLSQDVIFTVVDLFRVALVDARFSGYYAEEKDHKTVAPLIQHVLSIKDCPYSLRLVTIQAACNLFTSPLYPKHIVTCPTLTTPIIELITTSLLDVKHNSIRVAAASLAFNIATYIHKQRVVAQRELLSTDDQVALVASLLETISNENESVEALKGLLLTLGFLAFSAPQDGELADLLRAMDASETVKAKSKLFRKEALVKEIGEELLGKGFG
ncbi:hypothetical protein FGG08_000276 [Glutinoglossum americanum]|uniref:Thioredoxin n=1 Tax=Glutinoglossum americanum TaxID=1670608 RepID=A0A9P8IAK2_9PEZI|nr:hypothetical protein FGG08_000276 [Glutinoglossum americanum]